MKKLNITIKFKIKGDPEDIDTIKEDVYQYLQELMEEDDLPFEVDHEEEEDDEDDYDF